MTDRNDARCLRPSETEHLVEAFAAVGEEFLVQAVAMAVHRHDALEILHLNYPEGLGQAELGLVDRIDARDALHCGAVQKAFAKRTPCSAKASMCGVRTVSTP